MMGRSSPRLNRKIHAAITDTTTGDRCVTLQDIGLGGIRLRAEPWLSDDVFAPGAFHTIRLELERTGELVLNTRVVRNEPDGVGMRFLAIGQNDLLKIWHHIRESIARGGQCPYCDYTIDHDSETCPRCRWKLSFLESDYLAYWEKESLIRQMVQTLKDLKTDDLRKLTKYLDGEILLKRTKPLVNDNGEFVGTCDSMKEVFSLIRKVAPTDLPVLITGESGTGKELTARAIHERSLRVDKPFVPINCAAIPEPLMEAELFGYAKGAFTGAYQAKKGKFEFADQGTLFLDEIGDFPLSLQPKLLRFLEDQLIERVGSISSKKVDVRLIAATNRDIETEVNHKHFREDLYHRLKVFTVKLPPLRERGEDKVVLAHYLFKKIKDERDWACKGFTREALAAIRHHGWPGNVREMINRIRRAMVVQDGWINPEDLELSTTETITQTPKLKGIATALKKRTIESALSEHHSNVSQTAKSLGISRSYLHLLIRQLRIQIAR